jgi:hypothetical protein
MLGPAFLRIRQEADRENEVDETHFGTRYRPWTSSLPGSTEPALVRNFLQVPEQKTKREATRTPRRGQQ